MVAETERWELEIELPPVIETIRMIEVRCGSTIANVERLEQGWAASAGIGSPYPRQVTEACADRDGAVVAARLWVQQQERIGLLRTAVEPAVIRETGMSGEAGESVV